MIKNNKIGNSIRIERYEQSFEGVLKMKWVNRGVKILIRNKDGTKKYALKSSKNYDYTPNDLYNFIQRGDSLVKVANSNDLFIYRGEKKYYFKLGEYINK